MTKYFFLGFLFCCWVIPWNFHGENLHLPYPGNYELITAFFAGGAIGAFLQKTVKVDDAAVFHLCLPWAIVAMLGFGIAFAWMYE